MDNGVVCVGVDGMRGKWHSYYKYYIHPPPKKKKKDTISKGTNMIGSGQHSGIKGTGEWCLWEECISYIMRSLPLY